MFRRDFLLISTGSLFPLVAGTKKTIVQSQPPVDREALHKEPGVKQYYSVRANPDGTETWERCHF